MKKRLVIPTAEPFFFPGGKISCLLIHGFTGTPKEMRPLGERLANAGYTVYGPRLPGHATQPEDLIRMRWQDWLACVEDGYTLLSSIAQQTYLIGLSLGGMLSLIAAARFPVAGVVAAATLHHPPDDPRLPFVKPISLVKPFFPKSAPVWFDKQAEADHVSYPADPTRGYAEIKIILEMMRAALPQITAPVLLINSINDPTVLHKDGHLEAILAGLSSSPSQSVLVEKSGHVVTEDMERDVVAEHILRFIYQTSQAK